MTTASRAPTPGAAVLLASLFAALTLCSCQHWPPPGQDQLVVDGRLIVVQPGLDRDFFPGGSPPGGSPLTVVVELRAADSLRLPEGLTATHCWVVYGTAAWETDLTLDTTPKPVYENWSYAGGWPKWGPKVYVDVTVRVVTANGRTWDILVKGCLIDRSC